MNELTPGARASLVESIPVGLEDLRGTAGVMYTEDVLVRMTRGAQSTIDLTAMYWGLLPDPTGEDEKGFTDAQFDTMRAGEGRALFEALREAAGRGVSIRILQSPGFSGQKQESDALKEEFPEKVAIHSVEMGKWYGGSGIMHQKIWIFDARHIYLGSANMDWKSITQVKEMGVSVEDSPELAADAMTYFDTWWAFSALTPKSAEIFDPVARIDRMVPPWSTLVADPDDRAESPLDGDEFATDFSSTNPLPITLNGEHGGVFLTGSPGEVRGRGRTWDGDGLVHTIDDACRSICVSVMDFGPIGLYSRRSAGATINTGIIPNDTPVWWPSLFDALLSAALTRKSLRAVARQQVGSHIRSHRAITGCVTKSSGRGPSGQLYEFRAVGDQTVHRSWLGQHNRREPEVSRAHAGQPYEIHRYRPPHQHRDLQHDLGLFCFDRREQLEQQSPIAGPHITGRIRQGLGFELRLAPSESMNLLIEREELE